MVFVLGRDGGLGESLRVILEDVPDEALEGVLNDFSKVLLRVFSVVPSAVDNLVGGIPYDIFLLRLSLVV